MNQSFDNRRLVNTYGAFGSVGRTRPRLIIEGLDDEGNWREYEFKCKPGSVDRRPCWSLTLPLQTGLADLVYQLCLVKEMGKSVEILG